MRTRKISVTAATRQTRLSLVVETNILKKGWLERREGEGEEATWQRRFFTLSTERRDGKISLSLEYFLDEEQTEDEDSDTSNGRVTVELTRLSLVFEIQTQPVPLFSPHAAQLRIQVLIRLAHCPIHFLLRVQHADPTL